MSDLPAKRGRPKVVISPELQELSEKPLRETDFFNALTKKEQKRLLEIENQYRNDTQGELSESEYDRLATMRYFVDKIEKIILDKGIEQVPEAMLTEYRRANETLMKAVSEWRDRKTIKKDSIGDLKRAFLEFESKDGGLVTVDVKKEVTQVVDLIDCSVREREIQED